MSPAEDILQCSYSSWVGKFTKFVHPNKVLHVPDNVLLYLMSDIMVLPSNSTLSHRNTPTSNGFWSDEAEDGLEEPNFSEFDGKLKAAIQELGGNVFVKLNWSAPKDASWITSTRTLRCSDPADIYLLLKSSTYISNDLSLIKKFSGETSCCLVLKKWEEVHPGTEFRCFVVNKTLAGISQRDLSSYFKYIGESRNFILKEITDFFHNHVKSKISLMSYMFDLIVSPGKNIVFVDLSPLNRDSECLMFSWEELESQGKPLCHESTPELSQALKEEPLACSLEICDSIEDKYREPEFRFNDKDTIITHNACKHYGLPVDLHHYCSEMKSVADFIQEEIFHCNDQ